MKQAPTVAADVAQMPGRTAGHCSRCRRHCCACAATIEGGPVVRRGHVFCSVACAESGRDCGARPA